MTQPPTEREHRAESGRGEPATTREGALDPPSLGEPHTTRDDVIGEFGGGALPAELRREFRQIRQHAEPGGEAYLFIVEHIQTAERRVLKLYHPQVRLKPDVLERVRDIHSSHVVRLHSHGQTTQGQWYETQEHVEGANLVEYRNTQGGRLGGRALDTAIRELYDAVSAFHSAGLVHRDIKPENILVRAQDPLDLILIDFGLSVVAEEATVFLSGRDATYNYQAPELLAMQAGRPADWWSVGMTIAMLATGRTPYAGLSRYVIHNEHLNHVPPPIVGEIDDQRLRNLCRGLTRYRVENRWGADEVAKWLGGANPPIVDDGPPSISTATVAFNGTSYGDPQALARGLLAAPAVAESVLKTAARRDKLVDDILQTFGGERIAGLDQRWSARAPQPQLAIVELAVALAPSTQPMFRGNPLTPAELALLADQAVRGDAQARATVAELAESQVLTAWGRGAAHPELGAIDQRWSTGREAYSGVERRAVDAGADRSGLAADALILAGLADDDYAARLIRQRDRARPRHLEGQEWYQRIARADARALGHVVAGIAYGSEAGRLGAEHRESTRTEAHEQRRRQRAQNLSTRVAGIQAVALFALVAAAFVDRSREAPVGSLLPGVFPELSTNLGDVLVLHPDWVALVLGTVTALVMRNDAGVRQGYELAALLGAAGGMLYTSGSVTSVLSSESEDALVVGVILYSIATLANLWTFADSWIARTALDRSRSRGTAWLRNADGMSVRRTLIATLTLVVPGVLGLAWLAVHLDGSPLEGSLDDLATAAPAHVAVASVAKGLWVPLAAGALAMLLRGNWTRRSFGTMSALSLGLGAIVTYFYGGIQSDEAMDRAGEAFDTTHISREAVDGGFCGRVWTGTLNPTTTAISGDGCREIRHYNGWHLSWTYTPPGRPDELLSIAGMYLLLWDDERELIALDGLTGEVAWERSCPDDWLWIDESQLDQGENTPTNQRVVGACGDAEFDVDPKTGA